ncbi:hypothetical protein GlitD10_1851 [Gloeomargarita lithophora Alchichica-D10]|uniref:Uncharacterized protein n=1 Tax=Gloeomargarita lithophora Alchichica-D10 TaxID=1188229 RepID=A0A1J0AE20_9CYAN|nr:hypothetical protein [Gloeomargarita lithophora]APB34177.1 hypothetical protein GlitD10_1851 [Gloeomargarita lithophora Alchichica-D10]
MTERLGKRVSRSITFYPTPEDNELLEALDHLAATQAVTFSELCKLALRQHIQTGTTHPSPYTVGFAPGETELAQCLDALLKTQGISFSDWVKQRLNQPPAPETDIVARVQFLEQATAQLHNQLHNQPAPLTRPEIEQIIRQYVTPVPPVATPPVKAPPPPPPPKPSPATDPLIAELGAFLLDDF